MSVDKYVALGKHMGSMFPLKGNLKILLKIYFWAVASIVPKQLPRPPL